MFADFNVVLCERNGKRLQTLALFFSNNMLYPKEDKENRVLLYAVRILLKVTDDITLADSVS